jgi:hypothetical protein
MIVRHGALGSSRKRLPITLRPVESPKNWYAVAWLMIASSDRCASREPKVRPATSGIPIVRKYSPSTVV